MPGPTARRAPQHGDVSSEYAPRPTGPGPGQAVSADSPGGSGQPGLPSACRMGCIKSKFLRDRGKVSKPESSTNAHCPVYVPDPTTSAKLVSRGGAAQGPSSIPLPKAAQGWLGPGGTT